MNRTLNGLETAGLVARHPADDDARRVRVALTPAGLALDRRDPRAAHRLVLRAARRAHPRRAARARGGAPRSCALPVVIADIVSAMFRSFAVANYRLWFAGALVSNVGTWMQRIAQDWLVLTELTDDDATAVGITMALQFGPQLLLLPVTGLVADRMDRRRLLMLTQIAMAMLGLGMAAITADRRRRRCGWCTPSPSGSASPPRSTRPARQAFVSELVPTEATSATRSRSTRRRSTAPGWSARPSPGCSSPSVGAGWVFLINAVTFGAVLVALGLLRTRRASPPFRRVRRERPGQLLGGLPLRAHSGPTSCWCSTMIAILGTLGFNFPIFISAMARIEFGEGAGEFGVLSSVHRDRLGDRRAALRAPRAPAAAHRSRSRAPGSARASAAAALMPEPRDLRRRPRARRVLRPHRR